MAAVSMTYPAETVPSPHFSAFCSFGFIISHRLSASKRPVKAPPRQHMLKGFSLFRGLALPCMLACEVL